MMELFGKRGFEDGLSYPQITLPHLGDKHHEDQATVVPNICPSICEVSPIAVTAQSASISQSCKTAFTSAIKLASVLVSNIFHQILSAAMTIGKRNYLT